MAGEAVPGDAGTPPHTLSDKINWLIERAHPAGRGPFSNNEVSFLIHTATGQQVSGTTIWKLRNGQAQNPQMRLIEALAKTFGVPPAFFFDDYDEEKLGLLKEQVELLALIRDANITSVELRAILGLDRQGRQVVAKLIERTARAEGQQAGHDHGKPTDTGEPS
jgi:transcriptional regulator with XRE-family HTH domain